MTTYTKPYLLQDFDPMATYNKPYLLQDFDEYQAEDELHCKL